MQVNFEKRLIDADNKCEACSVFDVNGDGVLDIVCGEYWYQGPDFVTKHKIADIHYDGDYLWDFSNHPMDVTGNGRLDIITGSWWSEGLFWRENPGDTGQWKTHKIMDTSNIETIRYFDIDGDGQLEIFPNCPGEPLFYVKLVRDEQGKGTGIFEKFVLSKENAGHGLGFGDIDGDGRPEIITQNGIFYMPEGGANAGLWTHSKELTFPWAASVPILVHDVNEDGRADIIVGNAHNYGLYWYENKGVEGDSRTWEKHVIDAAWSQYHDMQLIDLNGDGALELLTGKRYLAHNGNDPGDSENVFVCYYTFKDGNSYRHIIDYGDPNAGHSGVGIYFWTEDLTGNGRPDLVAPGKEGLYLFTNK